MFRRNCLICESNNLEGIIDLGMHPFADSFIDKSLLHKSEPVYPLKCDLCADCGQIQTSCETEPLARYTFYDYSYTSANSSHSQSHWNEFASRVLDDFEPSKNSLIIEIGSNDGYLSERFLKKGYNVIGVDPSEKMAKLAETRGVTTEIGLFGKNVSEKIIDKYGFAEIIIANNVFNHADNPREFIGSVRDLLSPEGFFICEVPYWPINIKNKRFDQIYHEHVNYFTIKSANEILKRENLNLLDVKLVDYHGGSIRIVSGKKESKNNEKIEKMIEKEEKEGVFTKEFYREFMCELADNRTNFLSNIYEIKSKGESIVAVGAAAKGNTLLNFYNLDNKVIDFVTDSSPHKQNKYTPLTRIPITGDEIFEKYDAVNALILSWNISEGLKKNLNKINNKIKYLSI